MIIIKIIIFSPTSTVFELDNPDQPLGGADRTLLQMIDALQQEHEVEAFIPIKEAQANYHPFMDLFDGRRECDILIMYRKMWAIPNTVKYAKLVFYSQDLVDTPCFSGVKDKDCFKIFDKVILLSQFHRENFGSIFDVSDDRISIIGNAAGQLEDTPKEPLTFIYFSTPFRGLVVLMKMWKKIKAKYPTAVLHVYSSMAIYGAPHLDDLHFKAMLEGLSRMDGVIAHGSRPHREVMEQLQKSYLLLYPNTYPETYCNAINEARAARTPFITSDKGALKQTGSDAGVYIEGNPYTEEYQTNFLYYLDRLIANKQLYNHYRDQCLPARYWTDYAKDLLNEIKNLQQIKEGLSPLKGRKEA